jgi:hypothetical protein
MFIQEFHSRLTSGANGGLLMEALRRLGRIEAGMLSQQEAWMEWSIPPGDGEKRAWVEWSVPPVGGPGGS